MIAVDTNVLVRLLTNDDPQQARRVAKLMESNEIFIPKTVLLETEWVLRHAYGIGRNAIMEGFQKILGLPNVTVKDPQAMSQAVLWCTQGFEFADALHLASSIKAEKFANFDITFTKKLKNSLRSELSNFG